MITWKFDELEVYFKSKAENLTRDISKMAYANDVKQTSKITIIDGPVNQFISTDSASVDGDTSAVPLSTIPMGARKTKTTKQEASELPTVPSDVDNAVAESDILGTTNSDSDPS
jgi:hypothetical protein